MRHGTIHHSTLMPPSQSAFQYLYKSGQDDASVTLCGFDHASFNDLHAFFKTQFDKYSPYGKNGMTKKLKKKFKRPRLLSSIQCLALSLAWTRTRGSLKVLQIIFGLTPAHLSLWLRFARRLVVKILKDDPRAKVQMPTDRELEQFIKAIEAKYPALKDCWGAMDGLKLLVQVSGDDEVQRRFYNGWTHDHYITNLFLFTPDGRICHCFLNAPGCMHDSTMAQWSGIYHELDELFKRTGAKTVLDSAFSQLESESRYKSHQNNICTHTGNVRQNSVTVSTNKLQAPASYLSGACAASKDHSQDSRTIWSTKNEVRGS